MLSNIKKDLAEHNIYENIDSIKKVRSFMSIHVFAVWDFMSIAKRLQRSLTCVELPWITPKNASAARLINEIIFYEETDLSLHGEPISHLDMYLEAMNEIGADHSMFDDFINALNKGLSIRLALDKANVPDFLKEFVSNNIELAINGEIEEVAANFVYGREDSIPEMFSSLLSKWRIDESSVPKFSYYLKRHIDLDGDEHGPAAHRILEQIIDDREDAKNRAMIAAENSVRDRIKLWDGILRYIVEDVQTHKIEKNESVHSTVKI